MNVSGLDDKPQDECEIYSNTTYLSLSQETDLAETDRIKIISSLLLESAREERERCFCFWH